MAETSKLSDATTLGSSAGWGTHRVLAGDDMGLDDRGGTAPTSAPAPNAPAALLKSIFYPLFLAVVIVQGIHVVEHIIQLAQVYVFGVADDDALGLLGYLFQIQGTEEWLHLVFNGLFLVFLYVLALPLLWLTPRIVPNWAFGAFALAALGMETWHVVEHTVIISNVIRNHGCPCPGIGDRVLAVSDTQLHFVYNAVAYAGTVIPFWYVFRDRRLSRLRSRAAVAPSPTPDSVQPASLMR